MRMKNDGQNDMRKFSFYKHIFKICACACLRATFFFNMNFNQTHVYIVKAENKTKIKKNEILINLSNVAIFSEILDKNYVYAKSCETKFVHCSSIF